MNGPSRFIGSVQANADPTEDMELATKQYVDKNGNGRIFYGTCSTAAGIAAKVIDCSSYDGSLLIGDTIIAKFSATNSAAVANLTLAINNGTTTTTAKNIKKNFSNSTAQNLSVVAEISANTIQMFTYNGTYWILMNSDYNTDTNTLQTTFRSSTNIDLPLTAYNAANSATATKVGYDSGTSKAVYAAIPATVANQATYNPSTGKIKVPGNIDTNILTANELKGYVTVGQHIDHLNDLGLCATAEGSEVNASGPNSHAEGNGTVASGLASHAEGNGTVASGTTSHAEGNGTVAARCSQHTFGEYNIEDTQGASQITKGQYIEIVGNGTSTARSNARTLDWNGNEELAGNLLPMGTQQDLGSLTKNWDTIWVQNITYSNNNDQNLSCPSINLLSNNGNSYISMGFGQDCNHLTFEEDIITSININGDTNSTLLKLQPDIDSYDGTPGDGKTGVKILGSKGLIFTNSNSYGITSGSACQKFESTDSDLDDEYITIYGNTALESSLQMNSAQVIARRKNYGFKCKTNAVEIELMIGRGNENRGIWDATGQRWMIHSVGTTQGTTKVYVGNSTTANDYAEPRNATEKLNAGRCVVETGVDNLKYSTERLQRGCQIVSDTYGFLIGGVFEEKDRNPNINEIPIAVSGRVLAYPYESIEEFKNHIGWPVCSGPNGTVSIMTEEEEIKYPSRIVGTISQIPDVEVYYQNNQPTIQVNGRVWIKVK